jgi:hypothetical protein
MTVISTWQTLPGWNQGLCCPRRPLYDCITGQAKGRQDKVDGMNTTCLLIKTTIGAAILAGAFFMTPVAQAQVYSSTDIAPPANPVYAQPSCPGDGYIWTPGYWAYIDGGSKWIAGAWVLAPYVGAVWTPGYWSYGPYGYFWNAGYWVGPGFARSGEDGFRGDRGANLGNRPNYSDININSAGIHNNLGPANMRGNQTAPASHTNYGDININSAGIHKNMRGSEAHGGGNGHR